MIGVTSDAPGTAPAAAPERRLERRFAGEVLLVTGFPGLRARALVRTLAEREPDVELCLIVTPRELESAAGALADVPLPREKLRLIPGEPCAIDLGVSRQVYAELLQRVDRWFCLYQTTDSRASRELCLRANLGSAREVAEFATVAERLSHVTFLSSSIVFGDHTGSVDETQLNVGQGFRSAAAETLALGEALLRRRLSEIPLTVVRTPAVLGGRLDAPAWPSGLHRLLALVAAAPAEMALPEPPGALRLVHALPADFVAEALYAVSALGTRGHVYHFADHRPPTLLEVLERTASHFGRRVEQGFDPRSLGRLFLKNPGFWLSNQSSRALSEWIQGPELQTRAGDRLLERAGLRAPSLLSYLDRVIAHTEELLRLERFEERDARTPFEVVA